MLVLLLSALQFQGRILGGLTLMLWFCHQFCYHCLDDTDIAIQKPSKGSPSQRDPYI